jgi:hypothetical protein
MEERFKTLFLGNLINVFIRIIVFLIGIIVSITPIITRTPIHILISGIGIIIAYSSIKDLKSIDFSIKEIIIDEKRIYIKKNHKKEFFSDIDTLNSIPMRIYHVSYPFLGVKINNGSKSILVSPITLSKYSNFFKKIGVIAGYDREIKNPDSEFNRSGIFVVISIIASISLLGFTGLAVFLYNHILIQKLPLYHFYSGGYGIGLLMFLLLALAPWGLLYYFKRKKRK